MITNRVTLKCDVKGCNKEFTLKENIAWGQKPSFIHLPSEWKNFVCVFGPFYICPEHKVEIMIDGRNLE